MAQKKKKKQPPRKTTGRRTNRPLQIITIAIGVIIILSMVLSMIRF